MSHRSIRSNGRTTASSSAAVFLMGMALAAAAVAAGSNVPWQNVPMAAPQEQKAQIVAQHPCSDADLKTVVGQTGARRGFATQELLFTNQGSDACYLSGAPGIQLLPSDAAPQTLAIHPNALANVQERADLAPGDTAVVLIGTPGSCDAAVGTKRNVSKRLQITPPGGGKRALDGAHVDTLCGNASVLHLQVVHNEAAPTSPLAHLAGTINVPASVKPGSILHYSVTLTNDTKGAIALTPCPSYTQSFYANDTGSNTTLQLNCAAAGGQIAAGASATFDMQVAVPANLPTGGAKLSWKLQNGPGVGSLITLQ